MPYRKRGLTLFRDWEPDEAFDPRVDRLLVITDWGDVFVAGCNPENMDSSSLVIDRKFMPDHLARIPGELQHYQREIIPRSWDATLYPWEIFLYDGDMTPDGPVIEMEAVGLGWTRSIRSTVVIDHIKPIHLHDIDPSRIAPIINGLSMGQFNVREEIMHSEILRAYET